MLQNLKQKNRPEIKISPDTNIVILGRRGSGKTTLVKYLLKSLNKSCFIFDPLNEYTGDYIFTNYEDLIKYLKDHGVKKKTIVVCKFTHDDDYNNLLMLLNVIPDNYIIIEEADLYCSKAYINPNLNDLIKYGRHKNINYIAVSRRPQELHNQILSQSHYIASFKQSLQNDIEKLEPFGFSDDLRDLETFEYILIQT